MAINPKAVALAVLLGGTAAAGIGWAQTPPPTPPAADTAAAPAGEAPAPAGEAAAPADTAAGEAAAPADAAAPSGEAAAPADSAVPADAASPADGAAPSEAAPATDSAATPAPADAAAAGVRPPAGPAASAEAASVGQYYVDATHGDWTLRCIKAPEEGTDPCELYQLLKDGNGNSVSEVSFIPLTGEAAAGATIVAPLETDLVAGLGLKVDSGNQVIYPFNFCAPVGCVARVGFTQAELDALKRGNAATVSLLPYGVEPENRVNLNLSLRGFTAGMDAVAAKMPAPEARTD